MGSTPLRGCIGYFLNFFESNFRSHIKGSKWGRKYMFINYKCCNRSPQKNPFQFANGKLPHSRCRVYWAQPYQLCNKFILDFSLSLLCRKYQVAYHSCQVFPALLTSTQSPIRILRLSELVKKLRSFRNAPLLHCYSSEKKYSYPIK